MRWKKRSLTAVVWITFLTSIAILTLRVKTLKQSIVLEGAELAQAGPALTAIRSVDAAGEDFGLAVADKVDRRNQAEIQLALMTRTVRTKLGKDAVKVFRYYLDGAEALPKKDYACAMIKLNAHAAENAYERKGIELDAFMGEEVSYFRCQGERASLRAKIQACKQEAYTLVTGDMPPPMSNCAYLHDSAQRP